MSTRASLARLLALALTVVCTLLPAMAVGAAPEPAQQIAPRDRG